MNNDFYEIPRRGFVYLLLLDMDDEEPYYYVGKSFSNSISKVYSKHINGGYVTTKNIFSAADKPKLYILQDCSLTEAEAYRYIVAYVKHFSDNNLGECLNYDGTMWQSEFMKPETERIYQNITQEPLEELLERTYVARAIDADRKRMIVEESEETRTIQFNINVYEDDKASFDMYCKQLGVSRKDAFGMLLDAASSKSVAHYEKTINSKEKKIEKQEQEIKKLQNKLALATGVAIPKKEQWASTMYPFMLDGVKQYLQLLFPSRNVVQAVKSRPYKGFIKTLLPNEEYAYPEKDGFYFVRLDAVLWGDHKSCFYVGSSLDGNRYKFRYYSKAWFLGFPPRGSGYEDQDSLWLLGCKKGTDGAMDLIAAFPIPSTRVNSAVQIRDEDLRSEKPLKQSLADKLVEIERRGS